MAHCSLRKRCFKALISIEAFFLAPRMAARKGSNIRDCWCAVDKAAICRINTSPPFYLCCCLRRFACCEWEDGVLILEPAWRQCHELLMGGSHEGARGGGRRSRWDTAGGGTGWMGSSWKEDSVEKIKAWKVGDENLKCGDYMLREVELLLRSRGRCRATSVITGCTSGNGTQQNVYSHK